MRNGRSAPARTAAALLAVALVLVAAEPAFATTPSTTTSAPSSSALTLGGSATDAATVADPLLLGVPTGTVSFFVCGPLVSASGCPSGGAAVGTPVSLAGQSANTATASSSSFMPGSAGTWCFRAEYSGDSNSSASSDGSAGECFTVGQASTTTSSTPQTASIVLGDKNGDAATVTGSSAGDSPTGTLTFFVCGPLASASGCPSGGTVVGTSGSLTASSATTSTAASSSFTPNSAGTWCFRSEYSGDSNYTASSDGSAGECFTVDKASPSVVSTPTNPTSTMAAAATDQVVVTGNDAGSSPSGTVSFFVCGPFTSASGCPSGGQAVDSPVSLTPTSGNHATATSGDFMAPSAGVWCFRAAYSGDGDYTAAGDGSPGECFTVLQAGAPSATIASPARNVTYGVGRVLRASYSCSEAPGGPGLSSCSGPVPSGDVIDTSTRGLHTLGVTAVSKDGLRTTVFVSYTVAGPPSVSISSPMDGASYTLGESVGPAYGCAEDSFGPGLVSCSGPANVDTNATGTFPFTVTTTSIDGQRSTRTVHYNVVVASNRFFVSHLRPHRDGRVTFRLVVPGGGQIKILETAPRRALPRPKPGRLVFAGLRLTPSSATTLQVKLAPGALGRFLVHHHRFPVRVELTVTYTPTNGTPRSSRFSGLRLTP